MYLGTQILRTFSVLYLTAQMAIASSASPSTDVPTLNKDTFDKFINGNELSMVHFSRSSMPECQAVARELESAVRSLQLNSSIQLAQVDNTNDFELYDRFKINRLPELLVFHGLENRIPYPGVRKSREIVSYLNRQLLPPVSNLTHDSLETFKGSDRVVVVGHFPSNDKKSSEIFASVAEAMHNDYRFGQVTLPDSEDTDTHSILVFTDFGESKSVFDGKFDKDTISSFVKIASLPLVGEFSPEMHPKDASENIPLAFILAETAEELSELTLLAKPLAQKYRSQLKFRTVNIKDYPTVPRWLNLDGNKLPALSILQPARNKKYPLDQNTELSGTTLHTFVEDFINGKLKPTIRSQPVPKISNSSVIDFVGSNYDDVVLNNDQDVLVEFSAPWCGVCTTFAPDYEQLGKLYLPSNSSRTKVTISKIDISQNDVPDQISALPTFKLFPANSKDSPIVYTGDTTIQDLADFIRDYGFYKIDPYKVDIVNHDIASGAQQVLSGSCDAAGCSYDLFLEKGDRPDDSRLKHQEL